MVRIAFTGHRPPKTGLTYQDSSFNTQVQNFISGLLIPIDCSVITGGALGLDQIALVAAKGKEQIVAEPFDGFNSKWPQSSIDRYEAIKADVNAKSTFICGPGYEIRKLQDRNEWMVDNCDELWCWWDGSAGGTANCVRYAEQQNKKIRNIYREFLKHQKESQC